MILNIDNANAVGFFDSGVGGLSVFSRFRKILPNENVIYYGDLANMPYGNKTKEQLISFARKILNFFKSKNVKAVVIACNTSSAQAYDIIKDEFEFPIFPIIQSCSKVIATSGINRVGIFATEATVNSNKYYTELKKYNQELGIKQMAAKDWVSIVEKTHPDIDKAIEMIRYELEEMLKFSPDKIILGCTHYPYLLNELTKYAPESVFIDPAEIFVEYIKQSLVENKLINHSKNSGYEQFFVSANPNNFIENAKIFYNVNPQLLNLA